MSVVRWQMTDLTAAAADRDRRVNEAVELGRRLGRREARETVIGRVNRAVAAGAVTRAEVVEALVGPDEANRLLTATQVSRPVSGPAARATTKPEANVERLSSPTLPATPQPAPRSSSASKVAAERPSPATNRRRRRPEPDQPQVKITLL